jgi:acyl-CoA dehydrogenase
VPPNSDPGSRYIPPLDEQDWYAPDPYLGWLVRRSVGEAVWPVAEAALSEAGRLVPTKIEPLVRLADRNPPVLRQYDRQGNRVDDVEFHPAYTEIENTVLGFGVVRGCYSAGWRGLAGRAPRALISGLLYLFLQSDQSITGCPIGMMDAMARCLERNDPKLARRFVPRIAADDGAHMRAAMFLTEKAGGSDVGANETTAVRGDDGVWRLHGEKWFASCPHSDLVLVTARPQGAAQGVTGLGLFLMPRVLDDGLRNDFVVHRLKDKFGTHAMPSGEVGLRGAVAWPVGHLERGMRQMMDMVQLTRVLIAAACAGAMRRNTFEALSHTTRRTTFGAHLDSHPLMRDTLAELVVDSTAALTALIGLSELIDAGDRGAKEAEDTLRLMTPLCKAHLTERARITATEAMEVRGGNGYIEDWPEPRILRDVYVHAIWEGSSNVIALDVLRAISHGATPGFLSDLERRAELAVEGPLGPLGACLVAQAGELRRVVAEIAGATGDAQQMPLRRLTRRMAILAIGARLAEQATDMAREEGNGRLGWIAARYLARLGGDRAVALVAEDIAWLAHAEALLHGGKVPVELAAGSAHVVAGALDTPLIPTHPL